MTSEAARDRRTAYPSGRKEMAGFDPSPFKRKKRKVKPGFQSTVDRTPLRSKHRWRNY